MNGIGCVLLCIAVLARQCAPFDASAYCFRLNHLLARLGQCDEKNEAAKRRLTVQRRRLHSFISQLSVLVVFISNQAFLSRISPTMIVSSSSASSSSKKAARGAFIVLEGVDRCGKTTQVARLVQHLTTSCAALAGGASAWGFPNRTTAVGQLINAYLQSSSESEAPLSDEAIHLLFSANRWESAANLEATLAAGTHVICDRYAYSGVAFSSAKKGLSAAWCRAPDRGLPAPDAVLYLDLEPAAAADRGG